MKKYILLFSFLLFLGIHFEASSQLNGSGFYRLKNAATGNYINLVNDSIDFQKVIGDGGGASGVLEDPTEAFKSATRYLNMDINLVSKAATYTDPGTVLYLRKISTIDDNTSTYDIISQGIGLHYITTGIYYGTRAGAAGSEGWYTTITKRSNNTYTASLTFQATGVNAGMRYLGENGGSLQLIKVENDNPSNAPNNACWLIEPFDGFTFEPIFSQYGKYYTTFRAPFTFTISNNTIMTIYKAMNNPSGNNDYYGEGLVPYEENEIIPSGQPVIIEFDNDNLSTNLISPSTPMTINNATFTLSSTGGGFWNLRPTLKSANLTTSNDNFEGVLYHNYGRHGHDSEPRAWGSDKNNIIYNNWGPKGDGIGFFKTVGYKGSDIIYRLGKKDGRVGFWDMVQQGDIISGNEAYSKVQCALFPMEEEELVNVVNEGFEESAYIVKDNLYGVAVVNGVLYAKDNNKFNDKNQINISDGDIDGMNCFYHHNPTNGYDQSNWVALKGITNPNNYVDQEIHVVGEFTNRVNPEINVISISGTDCPDYSLNIYCPASFIGTQTSTVNHNKYFFVQPKPNEYAHISWAVYGGNNKFYVNAPDGYYNAPKIKGGFLADDLMLTNASMNDFVYGNLYEFDAVIKKTETKNAIIGYTPYTEGGVSSDYIVYPLSVTDVLTGVTKYDVSARVTGITYYNTMGVESDVPFKGVNIVVTTYDNGNRTTTKLLK